MKPIRPYLETVLPNIELGAASSDPPTAPRRGRRVWSHLAEGGLAIVLTLVCFVSLLVVLTRILPSATSLGELLAAAGSGRSIVRQSSALAGSLTALGKPSTWSFKLSVLDNEVMRKEANSIGWQPTRSGASLGEGDGIRTMREGMAIVAFDQKNRMRIGRNSLVVLRRPEATDFNKPRPAASFSVVSGELWGDFGATDAPIAVEVPTGTTTAHVEAAAQDGRSQFKVTVLEGQGSAIAVYRGTATVGTAEGAVSVAANQYVVMDSTGVASAPLSLLNPPDLLGRSSARHVYREFPPRLEFEWRPVSGASEYRIVIARDAEFSQVVLDERTSQQAFALGSLTTGDYWWRVSSLRGAVDGPPSQARRVKVVQDREPPALRVTFSQTRTQSETVALEGKSEPGTRVFVGGKPATVKDDGQFRSTASLKPGVNLVVVEAVDEAGNASYHSQEIQRVQSDGGESVP